MIHVLPINGKHWGQNGLQPPFTTADIFKSGFDAQLNYLQTFLKNVAYDERLKSKSPDGRTRLGSIFAALVSTFPAVIARGGVQPLLKRTGLNWRLAVMLVGAGTALSVFPAKSEPAATPSEIHAFGQFYALTPQQASAAPAVRIHGVVLCYDEGWNQLYIHDGEQTAWLSPTLFKKTLAPGMKVEIDGKVTLNQGSPAYTNLEIQIQGHAEIPKAISLKIPQLAGNLGQWIETTGIIRVAEASSGRLSLVIQDQGQSCLIYVMGFPKTNDFNSLLGCQVRVRGINASRMLADHVNPAAFVPGMDEISILEHPGARVSVFPVTSIESLLSRELGSWTNEIVHLHGTIVSYKPGESIVVRDATGSILANVIQTTEGQIDSDVDVWGCLNVSPAGSSLRSGYFSIPQSRPEVVPLTAADNTKSGSSGQSHVITRFGEILGMRPEEAAKGFAARLQGVVTFADTDWRNCFIQGPEGAIYSDLNQPDIKAGQWVEVTGQTSAGGFAPQLVNSHFRIITTTNLPPPVKTDLEELADGNLDSHWVQLEGVVRRVTDQWGHATLLLSTPQGRFKAIVPKTSARTTPTDLIDSLVSIQGACTSEINGRGQLTGITLRVPNRDQIRILEPALADSFATPNTPISSVATFNPNRRSGRRVKVSGCITQILPGQSIFVQDDSGGIQIRGAQTNDLQIGDSVSVLGFPAIGDFSPYLEEASFHRLGQTALPKPQPTSAEEILLHGTNDATLVQLEAQLVQRVPHAVRPRLVLQSGPIIFTAILSDQSGGIQNLNFQIGSVLRLTGVCTIQAGENHEPETFRLLVATPQNVVLVRTPPWWTPRHTIILVGSLILGLLLAWAWSSSLRRQVIAQTEIIRRNEQTLITVSRQAGMAEVATAVLHNVGNVLNSVNVSAGVARTTLLQSRISRIPLAAKLMADNEADLGTFMTQNPNGQRLPNYLAKLGQSLVEENKSLVGEMDRLISNIEHINHIVAMQQNYAKFGGFKEKFRLTGLIEDALQLNMTALGRHDVNVIREFDPANPAEMTIEKHKVLEILINLISNAKIACSDSKKPDRRLIIRLTTTGNQARICVVDNGVGIPAENLTRIFSHGFTTRPNGHGFGLHSAALAAQEMGGKLWGESDGPGHGAKFTIELPCSPAMS